GDKPINIQVEKSEQKVEKSKQKKEIESQDSSESSTVNDKDQSLIFGSKVTKEFRITIIEISKNLEADPNDLMAIIAFESAETFSSSIKNAAGSGATGLIQFMPSTAKGLGTS